MVSRSRCLARLVVPSSSEAVHEPKQPGANFSPEWTLLSALAWSLLAAQTDRARLYRRRGRKSWQRLCECAFVSGEPRM